MTSPSTNDTVIEGIMDVFSSYVFSGMPAHLIYVPDMRLVDRNEVFNMYKPVVEAITEDDLKKSPGSWSREENLHKVLRDKIKFATLSHRWLDTREPTFQDMSESQKDISKSLAGYHKLAKFCAKARDSAELDEAIQAMFKWYRSAAICIAYLACSSSVSDFAQEPWFTRGWTLPELLAPEKMKFYGRNWEPLSDDPDDKHPKALATTPDNEKSSLITSPQPDILTAITRLTEIGSHDLTSFSPGIFRVHQRLRWASRRTTTRVEDMAYSLIGIFDVSMPIAYGDGQRSWFRLMEIILQQCKSWDIFAWAGERSPYSCAIPRSPKGYDAYDVHSFIELSKALDMGKVERRVGETPSGLRGDHAFAMTRHGLQMKIPLLYVVFDSSKQVATIHARTPGYLGRSKPRNLPVRVICHERVPKAELYCLGIVNYSPNGLARRNHEYEIREGPLLCFFFTLDPHNRSWLRLQTENVIVIDYKGTPVRCGCSFETVYFYDSYS
ncbi:hypothetical protein EV702DRAFT_1211678 [Suillus placidus]|uniref:Heterokaryon incompatibility domain-containing protein n=1 Tax=Suillus placidus TaxID=48579 RepID=A0A9P7A037_9AGAM|nr:hypothetical protein EV702DRAFT_1211678 [Suillus placidus]